MSCYHPLLGIWKGEYTDTGKKRYQIEGKMDPRYSPGIDHVVIPCGKCIGCRLDYSRAWADRMMLELEVAKKAVFLTLTYDNAHCPWTQYDENDNPLYGSLNVRDCQLFMKRLRKEYEGTKIRFFLAGEYGPSTLRPHYHAIVFGLGLDSFSDLESHGRNELGDQFYISRRLSQIWSCGYVLLSDVSWKTCAYVSRYVTKKLNGPATIEYAERNVIPEFSLMSRKPGIGRPYLDVHPGCLDMANINIATLDGARQIAIPKYFLRQLDNPGSKKNPNPLYDPDKYVKIKSERKEFAEDNMLLKLQKTGLSYLDYLEVEEQNKLRAVKTLSRDKVY